jgi:hypothetical protein
MGNATLVGQYMKEAENENNGSRPLGLKGARATKKARVAAAPRLRCLLLSEFRLQVGLGLLASTVLAPQTSSGSSSAPPCRSCRLLAVPQLRVCLDHMAPRLLPCSPPHAAESPFEPPIDTSKTRSFCAFLLGTLDTLCTKG